MQATRAPGRPARAERRVTTRREWLGQAAAFATAAALTTGRPAWSATPAVQTRPVSGFDGVLLDAAGDLHIEQTQREHLSIEAEPAVLARIVTEVHQRRLRIGFSPGPPFQTRLPIRFRLELKSLVDFESRGSGDIHIGALTTPELTLRLHGSGDLRLVRLHAGKLSLQSDGSGAVEIGGGAVQTQRVVLRGSGNYDAPGLASREAEVAIRGSGEIRLAAAERLVAAITGSGDVAYLGQPRITQEIRGSGEIRRLEGLPPGPAKP